MMKIQVQQPVDDKCTLYVWWAGYGIPELVGTLAMKEEAVDDFLTLIRLGGMQLWIGTNMFSDRMYPEKEIEDIVQIDDRRNS